MPPASAPPAPTSQSKKLKGWSGTMSDTAPSAMPSMHVIRTAAAQAVSSPICCHSAFASRKPSTANSTKYATAEGALTAGPKYTTAAHAAASAQRPTTMKRRRFDMRGFASPISCIRSSMPPPYHAPRSDPRHGHRTVACDVSPDVAGLSERMFHVKHRHRKMHHRPKNTQNGLLACFSGDDATLRPFCNVPRRLSRGGAGDSLG